MRIQPTWLRLVTKLIYCVLVITALGIVMGWWH